MSNAVAIAAVTATIKLILQRGFTRGDDPTLHGVENTAVTILPLDKARGNNTDKNQLNLFLYQIQRNTAWVNSDMPRQLKSGETGLPPLPLNLWYLLTAFGQHDDTDNNLEPFGHHVLSKAMSILHDNPVLSAADIIAATKTILPACDLDKQIERVRITFQPLSVEEIYRLWTGFATPYRLSAAYEAAVTLIESTRPTRTPLPVLTRGDLQDKGIASQPDLTPPFPTLLTIAPPNKQPSALLNDVLSLTGFHLDGTNIGVQFNHPLWTALIEVAPEAGVTAVKLSVRIPNNPATWPAGFYTVAVLVQRPGESYRRTTNQLTFSLAPQITNITASRGASGEITFTVRCSPPVPVEQRDSQIVLGQRATLLVGDQEILAKSPAAPTSPTNTLTFVAANMAAGDYYVRLRIDGVDSLLVDRNAKPPKFDASQKVSVP